MAPRAAFGAAAVVAAAVSLIVYATTWFNGAALPGKVWVLFLGTALVFVSGSISAHVLKPYYKVERVLQISRLKPFLSPREYASIWVAFGVTMAASLLGLLQLSDGRDAIRATLEVFSAGWFGFLYTDAIILLRAKFPRSPGPSVEA